MTKELIGIISFVCEITRLEEAIITVQKISRFFRFSLIYLCS